MTGKKLKYYSLQAFLSQYSFLSGSISRSIFVSKQIDMIKRVAIPVENERLSEYFGECSCCQIFEIDGAVTGHHKMQFPAGIAVSELPVWLEEMGITDVITYKINPKIIHLFASEK
jgi:hypothetical protein